MKIKICDCYKEQLIKLLKENNEIDFTDLIPTCKHKDKIVIDLKNNLTLFLLKNKMGVKNDN